MFALSFTALFLEMMVIRWAPSLVKLIAFYANLMLLSSFLGLGIGAMTARRGAAKLFGYFPVFVLLNIGLLVLCRNVVFSTSENEIRMSALRATVGNNFVLLAVFAVNALQFVPLGQKMGVLFDSMPRLSAYGWDLAGSLAGTLCFALFSVLHFSPFWGLAAVAAVYLGIARSRWWPVHAGWFALALAAVFFANDRHAVWSPYHYITVYPDGDESRTVSEPPPGLATMKDPPIFSVSVNHFYYHFDMALDPARYTPGTAKAGEVAVFSQYFRFPYALAQGHDRALVLGGGGGGDVQGALASDMKHVDVAEIDPAVVQISRRFNPENPYGDPRVSVHVDDARSYLAKAEKGYDAVVFGLLDSHTLFSSMNNVRLDGYVYTVESVRQAYSLLNDDGVLTLAFYIEKDWLLPKINAMVRAATGREPVMYGVNRTFIFCVSKSPGQKYPPAIFQLRRFVMDETPVKVAVPTDDWPFLYLQYQTVPRDYLIAIGSLLALSIGALVSLRGRAFRLDDLHFGLLGMGFLLLETKSITDCSLYFGATWLVTAIVITGVLLMVMASNQVATRLKSESLWLFLPLALSLAMLYVVPRGTVLAWEFPVRLLWALFIVPLPIFFAGLVFSATFRRTTEPSAAFGSNLIGAMIGGFSEYLAMSLGSQHLALLVLAVYLGSFAVLQKIQRTAG